MSKPRSKANGERLRSRQQDKREEVTTFVFLLSKLTTMTYSLLYSLGTIIQVYRFLAKKARSLLINLELKTINDPERLSFSISGVLTPSYKD